MTEYVLTEQGAKILKRCREHGLCHHPDCGKPILVGQRFVSKGSKQGRTQYHEECYNKTLN